MTDALSNAVIELRRRIEQQEAELKFAKTVLELVLSVDLDRIHRGEKALAVLNEIYDMPLVSKGKAVACSDIRVSMRKHGLTPADLEAKK